MGGSKWSWLWRRASNSGISGRPIGGGRRIKRRGKRSAGAARRNGFMLGQPPRLSSRTKPGGVISGGGEPMKLNQQKVEDAVLAVLWLTLHDECRVWKGIDWGTMNRLYEKG